MHTLNALLTVLFLSFPLIVSAQHQGNSVKPDQYQLRVENGYGSGEYRPGDTIHIWSKTPDERSFVGWEGNTENLYRKDEWHTWLIMPETDLTVQGITVPNFSATVGEISVMGRHTLKNVKYQLPARPKGIIFLFHGTGGSANGWFTRIEKPQFVQDAIQRGFGIIATDAEEVDLGDLDGNEKIRWSPTPVGVESNVDHANIQAIVDTMLARRIITSETPLFALGMSNGGAYAPSVALSLGFTASAAYCADGIDAIYQATTIPNIFCMGANDGNEQTSVEEAFENYERLVNRG